MNRTTPHPPPPSSSNPRSARKRKELHYNEDEPSDVDEAIAEARGPEDVDMSSSGKHPDQTENKSDHMDTADDGPPTTSDAASARVVSAKRPRSSPSNSSASQNNRASSTPHSTSSSEDTPHPHKHSAKRTRSKFDSDVESDREAHDLHPSAPRRTRKAAGAPTTGVSLGQQYKELLQMATENATLIGAARPHSQHFPEPSLGSTLRDRIKRARKERTAALKSPGIEDEEPTEEDYSPTDKTKPRRKSETKASEHDGDTMSDHDSAKKPKPKLKTPRDNDITMESAESSNYVKDEKPRNSPGGGVPDVSMDPMEKKDSVKREKKSVDSPMKVKSKPIPSKPAASAAPVSLIIQPAPAQSFPVRPLSHESFISSSSMTEDKSAAAKPTSDPSNIKAQAAALRAKAQAEREQKAKELTKRLENLKKEPAKENSDAAQKNDVAMPSGGVPTTTAPRPVALSTALKTHSERSAAVPTSARQKLVELLKRYPEGAALHAKMVDVPPEPADKGKADAQESAFTQGDRCEGTSASEADYSAGSSGAVHRSPSRQETRYIQR